MANSFVCYIDESGDEGFVSYRKPRLNGGASSWLVIGACVVRQSNDLEMVRWRDEIRNTCRPNQKGRDIHFQDFPHAERREACRIIGEKPLRFSFARGHKPSLDSADLRGKNRLYFYLTRFLLERITWLCTSLRSQVPEGDGRIRIVFSRRRSMSYEAFRDYLLRLKRDPAVRIKWPLIDIDGIDAQDHSRVAGLQIADFGTSAIAKLVEGDRFGHTETSYAEALRKHIYSNQGNFLSYGLKAFPKLEEIRQKDELAERNLKRWGG